MIHSLILYWTVILFPDEEKAIQNDDNNSDASEMFFCKKFKFHFVTQ